MAVRIASSRSIWRLRDSSRESGQVRQPTCSADYIISPPLPDHLQLRKSLNETLTAVAVARSRHCAFMRCEIDDHGLFSYCRAPGFTTTSTSPKGGPRLRKFAGLAPSAAVAQEWKVGAPRGPHSSSITSADLGEPSTLMALAALGRLGLTCRPLWGDTSGSELVSGPPAPLARCGLTADAACVAAPSNGGVAALSQEPGKKPTPTSVTRCRKTAALFRDAAP